MCGSAHSASFRSQPVRSAYSGCMTLKTFHIAEPRRSTNSLLDQLRAKERDDVLSRCEHTDLTLSSVLHEAGSPIGHVYFPTGSYISLVVPMEGREHLEVGLAGHEGMYGLPLVLGVRLSPVRAVVQGSGGAWRMSARGFRAAGVAIPALRPLVDRYIHVTLSQIGRTAGCNRFHRVGQRVARWILMTADRARSRSFQLTHAFLAYMLGVRRVGVTEAAGELQRDGLIEYSRGVVTILDRPRLEAAACGCYRRDLADYAQVLPGRK